MLEPLSVPVLCLLASACEATNHRDVLVRAVEKGVQDEMDEQLRILNEKAIHDKHLRTLIIKIRDESYDAVASLPQQGQALDE